MLGAIVGDTVGSVYEFNNTRDYDFELFTPESIYTDDSVMSMAVAKWLLTDPSHSHEALEKIMSDFYEEFPCPAGGYGGGFLRWLRSPAPRQPYGSWGNGSAMRVSACGWFFDTLEETERVAEISASITHNHPEGIKGAQSTAACIWMARKGHSKQEIREYVSSTYGYDLSGTWQELNRTYNWEDSCQGTVPPAIVCFLESANFEEAIRRAVSVGGDSDTLACITGGIAEAYYGLVPEAMVSPTVRRFPKVFTEILSEMKENTAYGKKGPNPEFVNRKEVIRPAEGLFPTNLYRFKEYHDKNYGTALGEIRSGRKASHWIWYIFPQLKGLGHSEAAEHFGITGINEAAAFLSDAILGAHLREITEALLSLPESYIDNIMPGIDALKLRSSMTLFNAVRPDDIFAMVLEKYFGGRRDELTLSMLAMP